MLTDEQVRFFRENGYVIAGKLLEPEEVAELREHLDAVLAGQSDTGSRAEYIERIEGKGEDEGGVLQIINIWKQDSMFRRHHGRPALVEMARQLTGSDTIRMFHDQILVKPARNGRPVPWHHCLRLHGSDGNTTDRPRRGVISHLMPGHCRFDASQAHLMAQYAEADNLEHGAILKGEHFPEL